MSDLALPASPEKVMLNGIRGTRPPGISDEAWFRQSSVMFFDLIQDALRTGKVVTAGLNDVADPAQQYRIHGNGQELDSYIHSLALNTQPLELTLSNLSVKQIEIQAPIKLHVENCSIAVLRVHGVGAEVSMESTHVGNLEVHASALKHYEMRHGSLLNVTCPPPGGGNPFTGTVSFKDVFFPRQRGVFILKGPQPYRNMRHHLRSLENAQMANLIHSAELAVEREDDSWTNRVLSYVYEWASDFGSSALRPLLWQLLLISFSMLLILYSDGAVPALSEQASGFVGWQAALMEPTTSGDYARAFYLALQPLVNPIGIFGVKSLLVPRYPLLAVWLSLHGFLAVVLLALLVFAIRRRFKIQ
jgi:hypothetical protein